MIAHAMEASRNLAPGILKIRDVHAAGDEEVPEGITDTPASYQPKRLQTGVSFSHRFYLVSDCALRRCLSTK